MGSLRKKQLDEFALMTKASVKQDTIAGESLTNKFLIFFILIPPLVNFTTKNEFLLSFSKTIKKANKMIAKLQKSQKRCC